MIVMTFSFFLLRIINTFFKILFLFIKGKNKRIFKAALFQLEIPAFCLNCSRQANYL